MPFAREYRSALTVELAGTTSMRLNESATCVCSQASYSEDQLAGKWRVDCVTAAVRQDRERLAIANERVRERVGRWSTPRRALLSGLLIQVKSILVFLDAPAACVRARARLSRTTFYGPVFESRRCRRRCRGLNRAPLFSERFNRAPLFSDYSCFTLASIRVMCVVDVRRA